MPDSSENSNAELNSEVASRDDHSRCRNCGTILQGEYCSTCGQREGRGEVQLREVAGELTDDFLHWDSRIWRTLVPLLFRPGFLTAEFIAGRKARYVAPLRLYLIISFVLFLVLSLGTASVNIDYGPDPNVADTGEESAVSGGQDTSEIIPTSENQAAIIAGPVISDEGVVGVTNKIDIGLSDEDSPQWLRDLEQKVESNAEKMAEDPSQLTETLLEYLPQMMFVLLPLFALLVKVCYLFSPFHYLQHLVFTLHYHSFVYILYLLSALVERLLSLHMDGSMFLISFCYLPLALRRAYRSSFGGALVKGLFILSVDSILLIFAFIFTLLVILALA